ncbi:peptide-methionine (R)-S-oxide reductase MsrB [Aurantimonas sp. MSK8Z-1]|uniref:peptide-methionine (R)-S-oxide reductase MsrB n=1 Tax=Mangrovibrevibacter kandeliae TaxID=2968473 RepID=UPI002117E029|nr:peptide-methionine (R)-S-oxide reductase MsrB [Aurantimonas sp. MSK8Z-1]MCW4115144.1 peptide-methionine (R)-S-oxide reductase MsrB [Aurantimonas sp. MSK8Z-1]
MTRREILAAGTVFAGLAAGFGSLFGGGQAQGKEGKFPLSLSDEEWKKRLTPEQYAVLRQEGTERPFTSPLNHNKEAGLYTCAGCDHPVYSSATKFDSGTGWPSFWEAVAGGVGTSSDYKLLYPRTEVHCANCGGHLGHVFDDGPKPTGMRHCINGVALSFKAGPTAS